MADFDFYVNRQGIRGRKGEQGEQGFSPIISVKTQTAGEYVLTVQNEDGSFDTPNLRGNAIENNGGTYIRFNPEDGTMYTGYADNASTEQEGVVQFSTYAQLENGGAESLVPSSMDVYEFVSSKVQDLGFDTLAHTLVAGNNITLDIDDENKEITINASGGFDPSVQNTFAGYQTFETETGSTANTIYKAIEFPMSDNSSIVIGRNGDSQPLIAGVGRRLRIGTTRTDISAVDFFQTSTTYFPSVCISNVAEPSNQVTEGDYHPLFNDLNITFGSGLNVSTSGTGTAKKYTITATADTTNCVTLNTVQTITAGKTFEFHGDNAIASSPYKFRNYTNYTADIYIGSNLQSGGIVADGGALTLGVKSRASGTNYSHSLYLPYDNYNAYIVKAEEYYTQLDDTHVLPIFTEETLLAGNGITISKTGTKFSKVYTISSNGIPASSLTTTIDSQSTNDEVPSAAAVYNIVGDIESLLNNINSGNGQ